MSNLSIADKICLQSFFNCFVREWPHAKRLLISDIAPDPQFLKTLDAEDCFLLTHEEYGDILLPLKYHSQTGRHRFEFPIFSRKPGGNFEEGLVQEIIEKALSFLSTEKASEEFKKRILESHSKLEQIIYKRKFDFSCRDLVNSLSFKETEQGLYAGHLMHPVPKSLDGFSREDFDKYSPDMQEVFQIHYFRTLRDNVEQASATGLLPEKMIKVLLGQDDQVSEDFKEKYLGDDDHVLLPVHPWQAAYLLKQPRFQKLLNKGVLEYLGGVGEGFSATSSVRCVYSDLYPFMYKFSLNVKITNSLRVNKTRELKRGKEMYSLLLSEFGGELAKKYPQFHFIADPAYISLKIDGEIQEEFSVVLRENPFSYLRSNDVSNLSALCQDDLSQGRSRLAMMIDSLSQLHGQEKEAVCQSWFAKYLKVAIEPILWLYHEYGLVFEAHQQNCLLELQDCWPDQFYYRDNQGYFHVEEAHENLCQLVAKMGEDSESCAPEALVNKYLTYYLVVNHLGGLINSIGSAGIISEKILWQQAREFLQGIKPGPYGQQFLKGILWEPTLSCKANMLTRIREIDELEADVANQSVYIELPNPLFSDVKETAHV
ncbi:MAG: hypothetical protein MK132_07770 [Lentisphaerales bacterium]|nr:hypothetical protein [Lentisphaerales bacterium]